MSDALQQIANRLNANPAFKSLGSSEIEARWIQKYGPQSLDAQLALADRRARGEPLQYLLGSQQFLDLELEVGPGVLVPRPETELLVVTALAELGASPLRLGVEVGLGSGAISLALIQALRKKNPNFQMLASEVSEEAFVYSLRNASRVLGETGGLEAVKVSDRGDVLTTLAGAVSKMDLGLADFLISNPPYLVTTDEIQADVRAHEPELALFAPDHDPNLFYRAIADDAGTLLKAGAPVFVEVPHERAQEIQEIFEARGWNIKLFNDLTGKPRVIVARKASH